MSKQKNRLLCENKTRFANSRSAHKALNKVQDSKKDKVPCRVYFCDWCNFWHLTSKKESWL